MAVLGLDASPFKRGLLQSQADARAAGKEIAHGFGEFVSEKLPFASAVGALTAVEEVTRRSIEWGERIQNLANRLGMSTDAVQLWDHALRQNGSSMESAASFFALLGANRDKAMKGSEAQVDAFKHLGVTLDDLKSKRLEDLAAQIARVFEAGDPQKFFGDLRAVGGRGAREMVAAFRNGLADMVGPDHEIILVSPEAIANLKEAADHLRTMADNLKAIGAITVNVVFTAGGEIFRELKTTGAGIGGFIEGFAQDVGRQIGDAVSGKKRTWKEALADVFSPFKAGAEEFSQNKEMLEGLLTEEDLKKNARQRRMGAGDLTGGADESVAETNKQAKEAQHEAEKLARIKEQIQGIEERTALIGMSAAQKVEEIERRIADLKSKPNEHPLQRELEEAKLGEELARAKEGADKEREREEKKMMHDRGRPMEVSPLQRIGGYLSPGELAVQVSQSKSEKHLEKIEKHLAHMDRNVSRAKY
jgi:hypothetical protein